MPVDPKKLEAFANQGQPQGGGGGGGKPGGGKPEGGGGEQKPADEGDESVESKYGDLLPLLERDGEDIAGLCEEFDPDVLSNLNEDLGEDDQTALVDSLESLEDDIRGALRAHAEMTPEDATALGEHLEAEGTVDDGALIAGWLLRAARVTTDDDTEEEGGGGDEPADTEGETDEGGGEEDGE